MHNTARMEEWSVREKSPEANPVELHRSLHHLFAMIRREGKSDGFKRGTHGELTVILTSVADHTAIRDMITMCGFEVIPQPMIVKTRVPENMSQTLAPR